MKYENSPRPCSQELKMSIVHHLHWNFVTHHTTRHSQTAPLLLNSLPEKYCASFNLKIDYSSFQKAVMFWDLNFQRALKSKWKGTNPITMQLFSCYRSISLSALNTAQPIFPLPTFQRKQNTRKACQKSGTTKKQKLQWVSDVQRWIFFYIQQRSLQS